MRLARFRRFAWMLVLVLVTGLAAPAFASALGTADGILPTLGAHVHSDGTVHVHAKPPAHGKAQLSDPASAKPTKAAHHCPGCLTTAECAIACLGVGLLPASVAVPASPAGPAWIASAVPSPAGAALAGDLDPPRPVPVR